jgi:hypothetical protein
MCGPVFQVKLWREEDNIFRKIERRGARRESFEGKNGENGLII